MTYTITVTEDATDEVVKQLTVKGSRKASKVYNGMSDRIDWERFSLNINPELPRKKHEIKFFPVCLHACIGISFSSDSRRYVYKQ